MKNNYIILVNYSLTPLYLDLNMRKYIKEKWASDKCEFDSDCTDRYHDGARCINYRCLRNIDSVRRHGGNIHV